MKLLVYVPQLNPRIKYIFSFIFEEVLRTELSFSTSIEAFKQSLLPKFSYAPQPVADELFFKSTGLLFEQKIIHQPIKTIPFGGLSVPFPVTSSTLPFDVFAGSFYFLSRYEEYLSSTGSENQCYPSKSSLQHQCGLLTLPVIDSWAIILKNILLKHFPDLSFGVKHFSFRPIYALSTAKKADPKNIVFRALNSLKIYVSKKINNKAENIILIRQIIVDMQQRNTVENSHQLMPGLAQEHHLDPEMNLPKSYIKLIKSGIMNDYSMYYGNDPGFRAGTCTSFYWYDLQLEKMTQLLLHPVAATDQALLNNKTDELLLKINELIDNVKLVNGDFYFLSLCDDIRPK